MPFDSENYTPVLAPHQQLLLRAAELIRTHGHCKDSYGDAVTGYCAVGAIMAVTGFTDENYADARNLTCERFGSLVAWNDAPERTAAEVIAALEECARS